MNKESVLVSKFPLFPFFWEITGILPWARKIVPWVEINEKSGMQTIKKVFEVNEKINQVKMTDALPLAPCSGPKYLVF